MAFLTMSMYSNVLQMDTNVNVLLPEKRKMQQPKEPDKKYPVLYLLHGHGDDHTAWIRKSVIEYLTRDLDLIVVMPTVYRSYYTNAKHGYRCFDYIADELPIKIANFFPASTLREDTYVAGNSMGGYGAFKLALTYPERYCAAASLSGALEPFGDPAEGDDAFCLQRGQEYLDNRYNNFGSREEFIGSENDLQCLAMKLDKSDQKKPVLYQCCGTEDFVTYEQNKIFHNFIVQNCRNLNYKYSEGSGNHNWDYWNPQIREFLKYFQLTK